jgi:hypothetical protein
MNLGFAVHYVLAGLFLYLLLRKLGTSWTGAAVGGLAYQLSGVVGSYVQPGHDGKLFVTALLPLALYALVLGIRERRLEGHALLALTVGLALLSPQYQMTYYLLIAAALFALFLAFAESQDVSTADRLTRLGFALGAVVLGFGIAMIQVLPFFEYIPYSPRAEEAHGYAWSTSYATPWEHVPEFVFAQFAGDRQTYWGPNPLKLHSEYLGLPVVALAILAVRDVARRKLVLWSAGVAVLFLLISLGDETPFYRVWYAVMPYVKQTRAPGMAFYVTALAVAILAAVGTERLERGDGRRWAAASMAIGGAVLLLALAGVFGGLAEMLAAGAGPGTSGVGAVERARAAAGDIRQGVALSGLALGLLGLVTWAARQGRLGRTPAALVLVGLTGADLWRNAAPFWTYSDVSSLYARDPIVEYMDRSDRPFRVLDVAAPDPVYPGSVLMAHDVSQLLGHHSNEIRFFDDLVGRWRGWREAFSPTIWDLFAVRFITLPAGAADSVPGYRRVLEGQPAASGGSADLFERDEPIRYARLVPAAVEIPDSQAVVIAADPRFDPNRAVLVPPGSSVEPEPPTTIPPALAAQVRVEEWRPGRMALRIDPPAPEDAYVVVAENWYPDWQATVDGAEARVVRGNVSLLTVPVNAGAVEVRLWFDSAGSRRGRAVSLTCLAIVALGGAAGVGVRRKTRG